MLCSELVLVLLLSEFFPFSVEIVARDDARADFGESNLFE